MLFNLDETFLRFQFQSKAAQLFFFSHCFSRDQLKINIVSKYSRMKPDKKKCYVMWMFFFFIYDGEIWRGNKLIPALPRWEHYQQTFLKMKNSQYLGGAYLGMGRLIIMRRYQCFFLEVLQPDLIDWNKPITTPTWEVPYGNTSCMPRDVLLTIGDTIIEVNTCTGAIWFWISRAALFFFFSPPCPGDLGFLITYLIELF